MARGALLLLVLVAVAACGGSDKESKGSTPTMPKDDPARGIYTYDHARELGIRVGPIPPPRNDAPRPARATLLRAA